MLGLTMEMYSFYLLYILTNKYPLFINKNCGRFAIRNEKLADKKYKENKCYNLLKLFSHYPSNCIPSS